MAFALQPGDPNALHIRQLWYILRSVRLQSYLHSPCYCCCIFVRSLRFENFFFGLVGQYSILARYAA